MPSTVTVTPFSEVGAVEPLKSPPAHSRAAMQVRSLPKISSQVPEVSPACALNAPALCTTEIVGVTSVHGRGGSQHVVGSIDVIAEFGIAVVGGIRGDVDMHVADVAGGRRPRDIDRVAEQRYAVLDELDREFGRAAGWASCR